jgi:hypothetical protein
VDDEEEDDHSLISMDIANNEKTLLTNLIRQSQNENVVKKTNSFDDLTKLNKRIKSFNEQVCLK